MATKTLTREDLSELLGVDLPENCEIEFDVINLNEDAAEVTGYARGGRVNAVQALRAHPEVKIVLSTGQADTQAAGVAIERHFADKGYWSAGFDLSPETLRLIKAGVIRCTIDQQPYVQGFYPVVQLALHCRHGIVPSSMNAGAGIIDATNVEQVLAQCEQGYR